MDANALDRALLLPNTDDERWEIVTALHRRGDAGTFEAAARLCAGDRSEERELGADVLAQLGNPQSLPVLRDMARREADPTVLRSVLIALGHLGDKRAFPEVLGLAGHDHPGVRYAAAWSLPNVMPDDDPDAVAALVEISREADDDNRDCATTALAGLDADDATIRAALLARLDDASLVVAAEAAYGLARRGDRRAEQVVGRYLAAPDDNDYTCSVIEWTVEELRAHSTN
ncbi:hypothetical protein FDA94_03305 [Herbidospora galbida]|uniref:HEAT repeat domain-containing protein n=1 Tax=Herbidospora galbida TaxID=2575442 RepID=A0A4U3MRF6_9ACTN|nr:HEAT repeat domain-containing protein [Herbidospora galbida]TKK90806.1 hypothetical protein FDA94_03305 [Herbidospora galbida]